jgi:hypothetical protein
LPNHTGVLYRQDVTTTASHDVLDAATTRRPSPRRCVRPACPRNAASTLRFDYAARTVTLDPLAASASPGSYDLCFHHAARSNPPSGWTMRDRAPSPGPAADPAPPVGPSRDDGVDRLAAALCAVPRAASEGAPDAVPPGADRSVPMRLLDLLSGARQGPTGEPVARVPAPAPAPVPVARAVRLTPDPLPDVWCAGLVPVEPGTPPR